MKIRAMDAIAGGLILAGALGCGCAPLAAQTAIRTDRPGFLFSPAALPRGEMNLELGTPTFFWASTDDDPSTLVNVYARAGVGGGIELRAGTDMVVAQPNDAPTGMAGLRLGIKAGGVANGWELVAIPSVVLPVGNEALRPADPLYALDAVAGHPVGSASAILMASIYRVPLGDGDYTTSGALAGYLGKTLSGPVGGYIEAVYLPAEGDDGGLAGAGITWLVNNDIQLDTWFEAGLADPTADLQGGVGVSFRLSRGR